MKVAPGSVPRWKAKQIQLAARRIESPLRPLPRFVAGVDAAYTGDKAVAVALVYDRIERRVVETAHASRPLVVPYVPTYLSFREGPAVLAAIRKLRHEWGVICFDGQGIAHPRRCGLATHISVILDCPGVGFGKTRLIGDYAEPALPAGSSSPLMDGKDQIGMVLRTRTNVNPIFVSVGHRIDLESAGELAMACVDRFRIPEPTRQADIWVERLKRGMV